MDELARVNRLPKKIGRLLEMSSQFCFRLLGQSNDMSIRWQAAVILASPYVPLVLAESREVRRRMWTVRLQRRVPSWLETAGPIENWRGKSAEHALIANSLLTEARDLAQKHDWRFSMVAEELGFVRPDEAKMCVDKEALFDLYENVCGRSGRRQFHQTQRWKAGSWLDGLAGDTRAILNRLVPEADFRTTGDWGNRLAHHCATLDWNSELGISDPAIRVDIQSRGLQIAIRFAEDGKARGRERRNEDLPSASPLDAGDHGERA